MNLKRMTVWLFLLLALSTTASAQQATKADIQALEIRVSNTTLSISGWS
jgi:hypothetical protein